jgi:hypothetical protein
MEDPKNITLPPVALNPFYTDTDALARIEATLLQAISEANVVVYDGAISEQFRQIVRHPGEVHALLVEAMIANELL